MATLISEQRSKRLNRVRSRDAEVREQWTAVGWERKLLNPLGVQNRVREFLNA